MRRRRVPCTLQSLEDGCRVPAMTCPWPSGTTTLARMAFPGLPCIELEDPATRELGGAAP